MNKLVHPKPIDKEIKLDPSQIIMSKTDSKGIIEYANANFIEVSGYEEYELMGQPYNIIRHPDMPEVIFKLLRERLNEGKSVYVLIKNLAKDGRFYWVLASFETKYDKKGNIRSHYVLRKAAPGNVIFQIEKLYKTIFDIEKNHSIEIAEKYIKGLLEDKGQDYDTFILSVLNVSKNTLNTYFTGNKEKIESEKKDGFFNKLFQ